MEDSILFYHCTELSHILFKRLFVDGPAFHHGTVIVYGLQGEKQQIGYLLVAFHPKAHECIDPQLWRKFVRQTDRYLCRRKEKTIEFRDERRIEIQKSPVEPTIVFASYCISIYFLLNGRKVIT